MAWTNPAPETDMPAKKRELIETGSNERYARRDARGRFTKDQVDGVKVKMDDPVGKSLYAYLKSAGAPVSSYLPKALYDEVKTIPERLQGLLSNAIIKEDKHTKELNRLSQLKNPNPKELERAKLRERQRDDARRDQVKYRSELAKLKKVS